MMDFASIGLKSTKASDAGGIRARGFTLAELLVGMAVASIIMTAIYSVYVGLTRSYTTQNVTADVQQVMRAGIDFIVEDIMMAGFDPEESAFDSVILPIEHADATKLRVKADRNMNGGIDQNSDLEIITYLYDSGAKRLDQILYEGTANVDQEVFIDNVEAFSFTYLDAAGSDLGNPVAAADLDDIRTVVISMTVLEPAGRSGSVDRTYTVRVRCRNLGI